MNAKEAVNGWLSRINPADAGMQLNEFGQCLLLAKGDESCLVCVPVPDTQQFHLVRDICTLPAKCDAMVYRQILELNLPQQATGAGALAFDRLTGKLVFCYSREIAATDFRLFCTVLENLMNAASVLSERVDAFITPQKPSRRQSAGRSALSSALLSQTHFPSSMKA